MKPSVLLRRKLAVAGKESHDPLDIMNAFYQRELGASSDVHSEYWNLMVAVLCERIAKAEKELEDVRSS
jgi:hypothetical protein